MRQEKENEISQKLYVAMVVSVIVIVIVFLSYTFFNGRLVRSNNHEYLKDDAIKSAKNISYVMKEGERNIQILSELVGQTMKSEEVDIAEFQRLMNGSVFDYLEFVDKNGVNHNVTGGTSDASDRQYYLDAMKGNSGVEIIYHSRATHENLAMFYAPVYYNGEIVGSLVGGYQATGRIVDAFATTYFEETAEGYLCTSDGRVFASTVNFDEDEDVNLLDQIEADPKNLELIENGLKNDKDVSFLSNGRKSTGYITRVEDTDWCLVQIYPESANMSMIRKANVVALLMVSIIMFVVIAHELTVYIFNKRQEEKSSEQLTILRSVADIYYSMHLINLKDYTVREFKSNHILMDLIKEKQNAIEMMQNVVDGTMTDEYYDLGMEFSDITTLKYRLKDKQFIFKDLLGKNVGWIRMSFIKIRSSKDGEPTEVVVATQVIDEEKRHEIDLLFKSNNDEMTGLYNRRAYDEDIVVAENDDKNKESLYILSADVNGLKTVNDNLGHAAGDELIIGASKCLKNTFGKIGRVYRTGGDEFVAILYANTKEIEYAKKEMEETVKGWCGEIVKEMHISYAVVAYRDHAGMSIHEIEKLADEEMYKVKAKYYSDNHIDRRKR